MASYKDWPFDVVDYVATVMQLFKGKTQECLRWELSAKGVPAFSIVHTKWFDEVLGPEPITMRNVADLVAAFRDSNDEWGAALFVSRNRGLVVNAATYDKVKTDAKLEREFRLVQEWRRPS